MTTMTCAWAECGRSFEAERADARYCSPNCRAKASKERRRAEGEADAEAPEASAKPARPETSRPEPAKPPPQASPDSGTPFKEGGGPLDTWERFLALEERVDDLDFYGKQDQEKLAPLFEFPDRVDEVARQIPTEAKIKEWSKEAAAAEIKSLRRRIEELEHVVGGPDGLVNLDPALAHLEGRVTALEDPNDVDDKSVKIRVRRLEKELAEEIERVNTVNQKIAHLATMLGAVTDLIK